MKTKLKAAPDTKKQVSSCVHYWIVGHPKHGFCKAVCKYCGERKMFASTFADSRWYGEMPEDFKEPLDAGSLEQGVGGELY